MANNNIDNDEVDDIVPLKSNNINEVDTNGLPDLSQIDMSKMGDMMETLKNKKKCN
jgi:hypothetical protein